MSKPWGVAVAPSIIPWFSPNCWKSVAIFETISPEYRRCAIEQRSSGPLITRRVTAKSITMSAKSVRSHSDDQRWESDVPMSTPTRPVLKNIMISDHSGIVWWRWPRSPAIEFTAIIICEVPIASLIGTASRSVIAGTIRNPPPTPNIPERMPTPAPAAMVRMRHTAPSGWVVHADNWFSG